MITAMTKDALVARFLNHWKKWAGGIVLLAVVGIVVGIIFATFHYRPALAKWLEYTMVMGNSVISPGTRVFRDAMVALAAVIGIAIAVWRGVMFDRQTKTGEERLLRERFATAATLMAKEIAGIPAVSARVTGIHIMQELASEYPQQFMNTTLKIFSAYVRDNARITANPPLSPHLARVPNTPSRVGEDVKTALYAIARWAFYNRRGDIPQGCFSPHNGLDFSHANFSHLDFSDKDVAISLGMFNWENADLSGANLDDAQLQGANFHGAILHGASLRRAQLRGASLLNAELHGANLERAKLHSSWAYTDLHWARLHKAEIGGSGWLVNCFATDFSDAVIENSPSEEEKESMDSQIWHNMTPGLEDIREQDEGHWDLASCPTTSALVGAFRNFAEKPKDKYQDNPTERAKSFRTAAVKLLVDGKLPSDFPHDLRQWVERDLKPDPDYGVGVL